MRETRVERCCACVCLDDADHQTLLLMLNFVLWLHAVLD